ncbi:MAG: Flp family type IVb pilin [Alphaproteobacteria bacterium]|nr:Flp family type IVb pilin [Alphaproteobacteria bacterium]
MSALLCRLAADESGVTAIEYSLLCALMGVILVVSLRDVGLALSATFDTVSHALVGR